ncbi:hypothetical protein EDB89DRAFT_1954268 [Lactarius sanguifluus]|nr:hypothetical protein EDB89DRAFT_1954268 [Lactarius sanguifluus]
MDQHQHRSRSSSRSESAHPPASISVAGPHKAHASKLSYTLRAPPSPSASTYPSSSCSSHRHSLPPPAHTSTPHCNEANTPPHYITPPSPSPRRLSYLLPSPLITPSPVLPTLATMSPQVLVPPPNPQTPSLHDQLRSSSRSERLLRETLRRDRAASLSPRTRVPRPESRSGRVASTSSEMFHCACTDSDEEGDEHHDNSLHVSLLFVNPPPHPPAFQRSSKSSVDVRPTSRRPEPHLKEKRSIPSVIHINSSQRRSAPQTQPEGFMYGAAMTQVLDRRPDRDPAWSSPESSSLSSPTSSHRQALTPSPSPPSYAALPDAPSHNTNTRGRARNHTHPGSNLPPLPPHHVPSHTQPHHRGHRQQATPPPTPPTFDARNASAKLRSIDGYVSFANVEGLGVPPGVDEDATEEEKRRGWWLWRGRERSGSLGTAP